MIIELILLIVGFVLLILGSDVFVEFGSKIAKKLGVSEFVIGLTLIAVGTSLPELASSIMAAIQGSSGLIVGNLVGSNIANIGLIVGVTALISVIKTHETMLKRDGYIMMFVSIIFTLLALFGVINYIGGLILLVIYAGYVFFIIEYKKTIKKKMHFKEFVGYLLKFGFIVSIFNRIMNKNPNKKIKKDGLILDFIVVALSLGAIIYGARLLVNEAVFFSRALGISETFIGMTLIAVGTSLPELAVSISAVKKGLFDIMIGNIIGSNIANLALVFGISAVIMPIKIALASMYYLIPGMIIFSLAFLILISRWKIKRWHGAMLLVGYALFLFFMAFNSG